MPAAPRLAAHGAASPVSGLPSCRPAAPSTAGGTPCHPSATRNRIVILSRLRSMSRLASAKRRSGGVTGWRTADNPQGREQPVDLGLVLPTDERDFLPRSLGGPTDPGSPGRVTHADRVVHTAAAVVCWRGILTTSRSSSSSVTGPPPPLVPPATGPAVWTLPERRQRAAARDRRRPALACDGRWPRWC